MKDCTFQPPKIWSTHQDFHLVREGPQGMTVPVSLVNLSNSIHLCLSQVSCIASGLALLKDEQNFKLGRCVGGHETSISYANMLTICRK
jgi:hypothetical protein